MAPLRLSAPTSWGELSQLQLEQLLRIITHVNTGNFNKPFRSADDFADYTTAQVATLCLFLWNDVRVITPYADAWLVAHDGREFLVAAADIAAATELLAWTGGLPDVPVRLNRIDNADAVDASLNDKFSFDNWLSCEALWQAYQMDRHDECLRLMAEILYSKPGISLEPHELLCIFYWWAGLKAECARLYPNFMQPATHDASSQPSRDMLRRNMDAQIRALTKGDITKEELILSLPAHRALTELDALAREYEELNRKFSKK